MQGFAIFLCLQLVVIAPHFFRTPAVLGFALAVVSFRYGYLRQQQTVPKVWQWLFIAAGLTGLIILHQGFTVDSAADFLALVYLLKTLECKKQQESLYQLYLSFLIIASSFLFYQGLLISAYGLVASLSVLAYLHYLQEMRSFKASLRFSSLLVLTAIPFMLVAFYLFPRLPPLWQVPNSSVGQTGLPDEMSSGDIAKLIQSDELVFRVRFNNGLPDRDQLYWRALTLNQFDGRRWRAKKLPEARFVQPETVNEASYQLFLEPNQKQRFYFLNNLADYPKPIFAWRSDNTLAFKAESQNSAFTISSIINDSFIEKTPEPQANLQLPQGNNQTQSLVHSWQQQGLADKALVDRALQYFREQAFFYTLEPPLLDGDRIDDFLFNSRQGFCEHYAASFVVMMRFAGIPARVVLGYQGGQLNPYDNSLAVRQLDAHAWAEVLIDGRWLRVDPTAAVAPERILQSSEQSLSQDPNFFSQSMFSRQKYQWFWLKSLSYRFQQWDFWWQNQVLSFDADKQQGLLERLFGKQRYRNMLISMVSFFVLLMAGFWYFLLRPEAKRRLSPEEKLYQIFLRRCQQATVIKQPQQGANDYCKKLAALYPDKAVEINRIGALYIQLHYQQSLTVLQRQNLLGQLRHAVMHFRLL